MKFDAAVRHFGTEADMARALGVTRQAVNNWGGVIPRGWQFELEARTKGKLRADRRHWPDFDAKTG